MGGKRKRTRQYVYLCFACLIMFAGASCAQLRAAFPPEQGRCAPLQHVQKSIGRGDFEGAVRKSQDDLSAGNQCADVALFDLGLVYCHYANPKKDYKKSLGYFSRLVKEYPGSSLAEEAKIWVNVLETMEKTKRVDIELDEMKKGMTK